MGGKRGLQWAAPIPLPSNPAGFFPLRVLRKSLLTRAEARLGCVPSGAVSWHGFGRHCSSLGSGTAPAPQTPSPAGAGTMRDFTAFPVYEGAHKKGLWAIVPRGSIREEIKLFKKKQESPEQLGAGAWGMRDRGWNLRNALSLISAG